MPRARCTFPDPQDGCPTGEREQARAADHGKPADRARPQAEGAEELDVAGTHPVAPMDSPREGRGDGQQREDELAERQPEKQALLIVSDLFVDAYLDWISPPFPFLDFWQTGVAMSAGVC